MMSYKQPGILLLALLSIVSVAIADTDAVSTEPHLGLGEVIEGVARAGSAIVILDPRLDAGLPVEPPQRVENVAQALEEIAASIDAYVETLEPWAFVLAPESPAVREEYRRRLESLSRDFPGDDVPILFNFDRVPLAKVTEAFGRAAGLTILYDSRVKTDALVSIDVPKTSVHTALRLLLLQTGLDFTQIDDRTLMLSRSSVRHRPVGRAEVAGKTRVAGGR